jgi:hypothetical protein
MLKLIGRIALGVRSVMVRREMAESAIRMDLAKRAPARETRLEPKPAPTGHA